MNLNKMAAKMAAARARDEAWARETGNETPAERMAKLIRAADAKYLAVAAHVRMIRCDCGHEVPEGQAMNASLGTACPSCYDRMSN